MAERLQKYLAKAGIGSRRFCEDLIKSKKIKVNNEVALIGTKVGPSDIVEFDGRMIKYPRLGMLATGSDWVRKGARYKQTG